jgi:carbon-monoxide dehydrogenase medium subunit
MKNFVYLKPSRIEDAISALREYDDAYLLAGGTDLLVGMKNKTIEPKHIIALKGIPKIDSIGFETGFKIGSLTTIREIEVSKVVREKIPLLGQAAGNLGSIQVRNQATIGGNLCNASPAADMAIALLAMDSKVRIASINNEKVIGLDQFFTGPGSTVLNRHDILLEIIIPNDIEQFKGIFIKLGNRNAMEIGIVNIAILLDADFKSGMCKDIKIALGAVAPTVIRARKAEEQLKGNTLNPELISEASEVASQETNPISDLRASAEYRKNMVKTLVGRGIREILKSNKVS